MDCFWEFIIGMLVERCFENFSFEDFNSILQEEFDIDFFFVMVKWFYEIELFCYFIFILVVEKVLVDD